MIKLREPGESVLVTVPEKTTKYVHLFILWIYVFFIKNLSVLLFLKIFCMCSGKVLYEQQILRLVFSCL